MDQIGYYRAPTSPTDCLKVAIYGQRDEYLPIPRRIFRQVLVFTLGAYVWINVDPHDIVLNNPSPEVDHV